MKKLILLSLLACLLALPNTLLAQVTIGSNADPNPNAVLDLMSQNNKDYCCPGWHLRLLIRRLLYQQTFPV